MANTCRCGESGTKRSKTCLAWIKIPKHTLHCLREPGVLGSCVLWSASWASIHSRFGKIITMATRVSAGVPTLFSWWALVRVRGTLWCPTLCDPMHYTVHGILQARRIPEWVAYPFSRGSSQPRNRTRVSCVTGGFFTSWAIREALMSLRQTLNAWFSFQFAILYSSGQPLLWLNHKYQVFKFSFL